MGIRDVLAHYLGTRYRLSYRPYLLRIQLAHVFTAAL
jgi:hypothetical protein